MHLPHRPRAPGAGQKVLSLQTLPTEPPLTPVGCVNAQGFSLHAEVCCAAHERKQLEHLCRYITCPAIANERLTLNRAGDVVLQLKSPYHDGTTHIVMSPLGLMQRLAALVPRPRLHLIRFHGVLAPNAKLRPEIIPSSGRQARQAISLCLAFPARRSTHPALQRFTLKRPILRHQPAWAGPGCSSGCSISTSSSVRSAAAR